MTVWIKERKLILTDVCSYKIKINFKSLGLGSEPHTVSHSLKIYFHFYVTTCMWSWNLCYSYGCASSSTHRPKMNVWNWKRHKWMRQRNVLHYWGLWSFFLSLSFCFSFCTFYVSCWFLCLGVLVWEFALVLLSLWDLVLVCLSIE